VSSSTTTPRLGEAFEAALPLAAELHRHHARKGGGDIPYVGHLLSVAGLVIEAGGNETQAIAALLHDAVEDQGGQPTLEKLRNRFGDDVANIVKECSDTDVTPKPPWHERKQAYIHHLEAVSDDTILVSLADKLDNARAILRDFRQVGSDLWERFSAKDPKDHLWYYDSLLAVYKRRTHSWMVDELERVLDELKQLVRSSAGSSNHSHSGV
jgi:(p)ppGpp synthase/HD superfamily hydrolase